MAWQDVAQAILLPEKNTSSDNTITIWATGSDNVRQVYETLVDDFNTNSDYAGEYTAELQFMLSGTGTQSLTDMLVAAQQAGTDRYRL